MLLCPIPLSRYLEPLTKLFDEPEANDAASDFTQGFVCIGATLIADAQLPERVEPSQGPLDYPTMTPKTFFRFHAPAGTARHDAASARIVPAFRVIVALVGVNLVGSFPRPAQLAADGWERIEHGLEQHGVVGVAPVKPDTSS